MGGPMSPDGLPVSKSTLSNMKVHGISKWIDINNEQSPTSEIQKACHNMNIHFVNGNEMNMLQAKIAFDLVNN